MLKVCGFTWNGFKLNRTAGKPHQLIYYCALINTMAAAKQNLFGVSQWAVIISLLVVAMSPLAAEALVCEGMVLMHWGAGGSICVAEDLVEELEKYGFYTSDIPLPIVDHNNLLTHTCTVTGVGFPEPWMLGGNSILESSAFQQTVMTTSVEPAAVSPDYSTTNIQEAEVDEPDIVKNTATDIFVSGDRMNVIRAYPPESADILGYGLTTGTMLLYKDKIAVFEVGGDTKITILNVTDRTNPQIIDRVIVTGSMTEARLANGTIYVITKDAMDRPPSVRYGSEIISPSTHYFPRYQAQSQTMITAVSLESKQFDAVSFLTSFDTVVYASIHNVYIVMPGSDERHIRTGICDTETKIIKIGISGTHLSYEGDGTVPGYPIDQFAMSEKDGTFRIATTTWGGTNSAYKMNETLDIVGSVYDVAPGENMHSARFYGDVLYMVTFRQVDPFFVIDFSGDPVVLGELKLPGFSEYLHPYDKDTVLGVGRETVEASWGAALDGVKITVFDVSDAANPTLSDFTVIGDRTAHSDVLHDHKAALVSQRVISIPVTYDGQTTFHVYNIENDILVKRGIVQHDEAAWARSLYIGDHLYTITPGVLKIIDLDGFVFVKQMNLD